MTSEKKEEILQLYVKTLLQSAEKTIEKIREISYSSCMQNQERKLREILHNDIYPKLDQIAGISNKVDLSQEFESIKE